MKTKIIDVDFIDGRIQIPEDVWQRIREACSRPVKFTRDCPKLTDEQLSKFVRYEDFVRNRDLLKKDDTSQENTQ